MAVATDPITQVRVHFIGKQEFCFAPGEFETPLLSEQHILLLDYIEPWIQLFIGRPLADPSGAARDLLALTTEWSDGWRSLERYANPVLARVLEQGWGSVMSGPESLIRGAEGLLAAQSAAPNVLYSARRTHQTTLRALCLGRSFVVAEHFEFERIEAAAQQADEADDRP